MHSAYSAAGNIGNPSMVILPAVEHAIARTLPFTSLDHRFTNYITLWMSNTDINGLRLDGTVMDSWTVIGVAFDGAVVQTQVVPGIITSVILIHPYDFVASHMDTESLHLTPTQYITIHSQLSRRFSTPSLMIAKRGHYPMSSRYQYSCGHVGASNSFKLYAMLPDYSNYISGDAFNIGVTKVTYQFSDVHGSVLECNFDVIVQDVTAPAVYGCPSSYNISTCDSHPLFQWEEPFAEDNSRGLHLLKQVNVDGDADMSSTVVTYEFSDDSDNIATCVVKIDNSPVGTCNFGPNRNAVVNAVVFLGLITYFLMMVVSCQLCVAIFTKLFIFPGTKP
ncbi:putative hyalin [Apostichopus japonicus]|uniref:Putative hyalin n=1 Tax=Stichopus japonicus TaxID=307972 RepID=A0A2G8KQT9_STIJA|nr:putative hyalin [Apostichopus japonicus]